MNDNSQDRINDFLSEFRQALGQPGGRREDTIAEVRADLEAHIEHHRSAGKSQTDAVDLALTQMGDPLELARQVRREASPFDGPVLTGTRFAAAGALILWLLAMLWFIRAGTYGLDGFTATLGITLLHLPLILLVWPRIVWRKNWLFGLIPAGIAFGIALFLAVGGTESRVEFSIPIPTAGEEAVDQAQMDAIQNAVGVEEPLPSPAAKALFAVAGGITVFLLVAMQRRTQRRTALVAMVFGMALVEVPFQIEELLFRREIQKARDQVQASEPSPGVTVPLQPGDKPRRGDLKILDGRFILTWSQRPLSPSNAIIFDSVDDRIRVQD